MKKHLFKFALTLFVCMLSNVALADENYLVNEDFSTFPSGYSHSYSTPNSYKGWTLRGCKIETPQNSSNIIYKVENLYSDIGYATTPALNYSGNVLLSIRYGTNKNSSTFSISMDSNMGTFDNNSSSKEVVITERTDGNLISQTYIITGVKKETKIKFQQKTTSDYFYIDDVKVIKLGEITLNDQINSSEAIAANNETSCTVKTERTLKANIWNTLCLPFNVDKDLLEATFDTNVELRVFEEYDDATYTMKFKTPENNSIAAGTPFLIKVNAEIKDPTFTGVTISDIAAQANGNDGVSFVGTYSPVELNTDGTNLFITTVNELAKPTTTGNKMPGLRAYIVVPENFNTSSARLFLDDEATSINSIETQKATNNATLYNLQGQRVKHPRSGLYIKNNKLTIIR